MGKSLFFTPSKAESVGPSRENDVIVWKKTLSEFQTEKYTCLFQLFSNDQKHLIEKADIDTLVKRITKNWPPQCKLTYQVKDVFETFYECLVEQVLYEKTSINPQTRSWEEARKPKIFLEECKAINLTTWLNMWGKLCFGSSGISNFPIWVQLLPQIFYTLINTDGNGSISADELKAFYQEFVKLPAQDLEKATSQGYRAMTMNGDEELTLRNFLYCFSNLLLGKGDYGPGKYIIGLFDREESHQSYKIIYDNDD